MIRILEVVGSILVYLFFSLRLYAIKDVSEKKTTVLTYEWLNVRYQFCLSFESVFFFFGRWCDIYRYTSVHLWEGITGRIITLREIVSHILSKQNIGRNISVIVYRETSYDLDGQEIWVRFPAEAKYFSLLRSVQTGSVPWGKAAGAWSWPFIYNAEVKNGGTIPPLSYTPSWRDA
jgi:hypothetical protein